MTFIYLVIIVTYNYLICFILTIVIGFNIFLYAIFSEFVFLFFDRMLKLYVIHTTVLLRTACMQPHLLEYAAENVITVNSLTDYTGMDRNSRTRMTHAKYASVKYVNS